MICETVGSALRLGPLAATAAIGVDCGKRHLGTAAGELANAARLGSAAGSAGPLGPAKSVENRLAHRSEMPRWTNQYLTGP